jgi:protein-disulfide isomerase
MIRIVVAFCLLLFGSLTAPAAQFGPAQYPIKADDGTEITNFDLGAGLLMRMGALESLIPVGNLNGDVALFQFYDLNCPFCREAARDVDQLVKSDPKLKLVFVPYPVLSIDSVRGGLVEVMAARMLPPEKFMEFHRRIYAGRGVIDGARALEVAVAMGLDREKVIAGAQTEATLAILKSHADFGGAAKLIGTPAYVLNGVAIVGHPGLKALQKSVAAVRKCGKVTC